MCIACYRGKIVLVLSHYSHYSTVKGVLQYNDCYKPVTYVCAWQVLFGRLLGLLGGLVIFRLLGCIGWLVGFILLVGLC
jgi:hypothetical protein